MKKILSSLLIFMSLGNCALCSESVNVYYFYGSPRCITCKKMEAYTKSAVDSMKDKNIIYKPINIDEKSNKHFVKKYNLYTKTVILSKVNNGKEASKNLDKIWLKVKNEKDYKNYIIKEIKEFNK